MVALLNECEGSANFAAHHAASLRRRGASRCEYLRTPVEDRAGGDWLAERERHRAKPRPRVLLIGHLRGISTLEGLDLFARGMLPRLEARLGEDGFEARIVGAYEAPRHLTKALARPTVRLLGHVGRVEDEFRAADLVLVPTPIPLGARVRILSAFSFGCPVVAHDSNALGIPELVHEDNVLLGHAPGELADGVLRVLADESLARRLERRGRDTFERYFAPPVAAGEVARRLHALGASAADGAPRARSSAGRAGSSPAAS
jgi:glycosyltransferase involved in cell wall biosynthesis